MNRQGEYHGVAAVCSATPRNRSLEGHAGFAQILAPGEQVGRLPADRDYFLADKRLFVTTALTGKR